MSAINSQNTGPSSSPEATPGDTKKIPSTCHLRQEVQGKCEVIFEERIYLDDLKLLIEKEYAHLLSRQPEDALPDLIDAIGALKRHHKVPADKRNTFPETRQVIRDINFNGWVLQFGANTYPVPGSLASLNRLLKNKVVSHENVSIITGTGANIQEGVRFVKEEENGHGLAQKYFIPKQDTIESIRLDMGNHISLAHGSVFIAKALPDNAHEIKVNIGDDSFIWINASIASGVCIGKRSTVWWNSKIGFDVNIGDDVTIGMASEVQNGVVIPSNCLIPNRALIARDFKIIPFEEYQKNEIKYDTEEQSAPGRRNFVVTLDSRDNGERWENSYDAQLSWINPDYYIMSQFNGNVTRENKEFAVIDSFLNLIHGQFPELGILRETEIIYETLKKVVTMRELCTGKIPEDLIRFTLAKGSRVTYKAYPKNRSSFIFEWIPKIIGCLQRGEDISDMIQSLLSFPKITGDEQDIFFGNNVLTGNCDIQNSFIYGSYIRCDEMGEHLCEIEDSILVKSTVHGGGPKTIKEGSRIINAVIHGEQNIGFFTKIWEIGYPTTCNNTSFKGCTIVGGGAFNNVTAVNSEFNFATTISATKDQCTTLDRVVTDEWVLIGRGNHLTNVEMMNGMTIANEITLANSIVTPKGIYVKKTR